MNYKASILAMRNDADYQQLSAAYGKMNLFNVLKIERNENRHSAFLAWLLNPAAEHGLGVEPAKKLLALYAYNAPASGMNTLLLSGNYRLEVNECCNEKPLAALTESPCQDRLDIWMLMTITDNEGKAYSLPLMIENKVYSSEDKLQTERYHEAMQKYVQTNGTASPIEIYLTADKDATCACPTFTHLNYQQLLDYVLEPLAFYPMPGESKNLLDAYIDNLGTPAAQSTDEDVNPQKWANTIMAISTRKSQQILALYHAYESLIKAALVASAGSKAEALVGQQNCTTEEEELLQNFWDSNLSLFNTILYVCRDHIAPGKEQQLMEIFKQSRRDTSRYLVEWETSGNGTDWQPVKGFEKPMSKAKAAAVFFMQWMELHPSLSITDVRKAFPTDINTYYARNKKKGQYDSVIWLTKDDVHAETESGFTVDIAEQAAWDLYPIAIDPRHKRPIGLGFGPVWEGMHLAGKAMIVKMWRKEDFECLLHHIEANRTTWFQRVRIVAAK